MEISTIGFDLAKNVFQVHGVDEVGKVAARRHLRRAEVIKYFTKLPPCLIGMEACGSAHYWAHRLAALGHDVRLMAPIDVKAYVKRGKKNDATDAEAICEAVSRPKMRFVPIKSAEQQAILVVHRTRSLLVGQRTTLINVMRSHLAELGMIAAQGNAGFKTLVRIVRDETDERLPPLVRQALDIIVEQIDVTEAKIEALEKKIVGWHRNDEASCRLATIPGVGPITASAIVATVGDASRFDSPRQFASWLGLVPGQNSSGGKDRLGRITKAGDRYLRTLLVIGATGRLRYVPKDAPANSSWLAKLRGKKPPRLVSVALANKMARIAWKLMVSGETYRAPDIAAA